MSDSATRSPKALGGRTPGACDLPRLPYTRRVIEESLRLYPPVYAVIRDVVADDEIGGFRVPGPVDDHPQPYVTHRHPDFWPDPETFDPDRFLPTAPPTGPGSPGIPS